MVSQVIDMDARKPRISPLRVLCPTEWEGQPVPERQWFLHNICARGDVTLLNGDGGIGKSLLCQQLQTALALGMPWLGIKPPNEGIRSLGIYCEDKGDELHRRQERINGYYGCSYKDLDNVIMLDRVGEANALMTFNRRDGGSGQITNFYRQIDAMIEEHSIEAIVIDTAADTFSGNEIDRESVRTFVQKLRAWAIKTNGTVILTQHPSVTGMQTGTGSSGSTGWHNSVRSRLYMQRVVRKDEDGDEIPTDERELVFKKANYGPLGNKIRMIWKDGVFVTLSEVGGQSIFDTARSREALLDLAAELMQQGIEMSPDPQAKSSLIARAKSHKDLKALRHSDLVAAQKHLIEGDSLKVVTVKKRDRHLGTLIRPHWMRYPGEQSEGNP